MMSDSEVDETPPPPSLAATRSRREKSDKHGRFAALQKFKVRLANYGITVAFCLFTFKIKVLKNPRHKRARNNIRKFRQCGSQSVSMRNRIHDRILKNFTVALMDIKYFISRSPRKKDKL
jgi:hypothetical protein